MLSPASYYKSAPKTYAENLDWRRYLLDRADRNKRVRDALVEACSADLLFWLNAFGWTFDPRPRKTHPFITYPFQDRALVLGDADKPEYEGRYSILDCIENEWDLVIYKSRDMGATWMCLSVMTWLWQFHDNCSFFAISRNEDAVGKKGDPDSLFWKVEFLLKNQPEWLVPHNIDRRDMHLGNEERESTVDGAATTATALVGGRRTAAFVDEFSRIPAEKAAELKSGMADATRCVIYNFTTYGTGHPSYPLTKYEHIRKLKLHWREHPEKSRGLYQYNPALGRVEILDKNATFPADYPFIQDGKLRSFAYDSEEKRRGNPMEMAMHWDIDFEGSQYNFFPPEKMTELQHTTGRDPIWQGEAHVDDSGHVQKLVQLRGGPIRMWIPLDIDNRPRPSTYGAGADISAGTGKTNSCLSIMDGKTGEKVLEFATPGMRPDQFARHTVALCRLFSNYDHDETAKLLWENAGAVGTQFYKKLQELGYGRIGYSANERKPGEPTNFDMPGWYPSGDNKEALLMDYRTALLDGKCTNPSVEALEECKAFIQVAGGKLAHTEERIADPTGAGHNHGDRVIADALAWRVISKTVKAAAIVNENPELNAPMDRRSLAGRRQIRRELARARDEW